ncbi:sensor histidine kinase [Leptolyngbya sp. 7M]|uniref:sensor histidine kinase n=1 Tax=Leptolyngbya sp. 7M TaxID=2812896 RepID=UPI001B8C0FE1|nr:ATP-binding protein [Leptolyngbya sp. 7M]QYO63639.1 hypothetical protein JVX88_27780 [Leptolyngbya sp. 7M]
MLRREPERVLRASQYATRDGTPVSAANACYAVYKQQQQNPAHTPRIAITTRKFVDQIEIKIWDNGIGIESDALTKVFDPFFTTKANEGTGLGLSITYDVIVSQHHGTLSVNSEPGSFTEFIVTLPL